MAPTPTEIPAELVLDPRSRHAGGHSGRPLGPCLGRYESHTSHCRGQSSALFYGHILGCDLGRLHLAFLGLRWYYKTPIIDLEIWTFVLDFVGLVIYCRSCSFHYFLQTFLDYFW